MEERIRFQARLLDAVGQAVIATDTEGRIIYWNRAAEGLYGWSAEEVMGRPIVEVTPSEELAEKAQEIMSELLEGRIWSGEFTVRRKDGTTFPAMVTDTAVHDEQGNLVAIIGVSTDITERHSEKRYRALTQNSSDLVTLLGATGTIRYLSVAIERMLGYSSEELLGKNIFDYVHPDDVQRVEIAFAEGLKLPEGRPEVEYRFRHKDGSWVWLESVGTNLLGDPAVSSYVINSRDVTGRKESEEALRESENRLRVLFENSSDMISLINPDNTVRYISPSVKRLLGYEPEELEGTLVSDLVHPVDFDRFGRKIVEEVQRGISPSRPVEARYQHKDGSWRHLETTFNALIDDPNVRGIVCTTRDVTERKEAEEALRSSEEFFRALYENVNHPIFLVDEDLSFVDVNPYSCEFYGYSREEFRSMKLQDITPPQERESQLGNLEKIQQQGNVFVTERQHRKKNGEIVTVTADAAKVTRSGQYLYVSKITDVTERKRAERQLEHQAFHDLLTDLPNRYLLVDRLKQALRRTRRKKGRQVALLFMDLDNFKTVNDSLGHQVGDFLLVLVAERLKSCLRPEDTLARFGGDEFVVLIDEVEDPAEVVRVAERITQELRRPFAVDGRELFARASIGIALGDARTKDPQDLLRDADTVMYRAKESGSGYSVFDPAMYLRAVGRLEVENDLRRGVEAEEFVVQYQPMVYLGDGAVWGLEALVRWKHPQRGLLDPEEFVPIAEESGLVVPLGEAVLEEACLRAVEWQEEHPHMPPLVMSVNFSARQLARPDLAKTVQQVLRETGLEAGRLSLDITETVYIKALEGNTSDLDRLKELGVGISIDDFGMGYSSLAYLKRLPADALKIDRSFVKGLGEDLQDTAIVRMIIELAHTLGMEVIAEGVEEWAQAALLAEMGCDLAQGFYFSRPLPPEEVPGFLAG